MRLSLLVLLRSWERYEDLSLMLEVHKVLIARNEASRLYPVDLTGEL